MYVCARARGSGREFRPPAAPPAASPSVSAVVTDVSGVVARPAGNGHAEALKIDAAEDLLEQLPRIWQMSGPVLIELTIEREDSEPRWAGVPMAKQTALLKEQLALS